MYMYVCTWGQKGHGAQSVHCSYFGLISVVYVALGGPATSTVDLRHQKGLNINKLRDNSS